MMRGWVVALAVVMAAPALAADPVQRGPTPERRAQMRAVKLDQLVQQLGLSQADGDRLKADFERLHQQRLPIRDEIQANARIVAQAARGDAAAQAKVDEAINKLFDARARMAALDREAYQQLSRGLNGEQRAKLAIFFARHAQMGPGMGPGGRGPGRGMGRGMGMGPGGGFGPGSNPDCPNGGVCDGTGPHGRGPQGGFGGN